MKYYSEKLEKLFETEEELKSAEKARDEEEAKEKVKREQRAERAKEVEEAYKKYIELLNQFVKDYGNYHCSVKDGDDFLLLVNNLLRWPF